MRKVTTLSAFALKNGTPFKMGNTKVMGDKHSAIMTLHDNVIATYDRDNNKLLITDSGWRTNTTKERLNGIIDVFGIDSGIYQKDFTWFTKNHGVWSGMFEWTVK